MFYGQTHQEKNSLILSVPNSNYEARQTRYLYSKWACQLHRTRYHANQGTHEKHAKTPLLNLFNFAENNQKADLNSKAANTRSN